MKTMTAGLLILLMLTTPLLGIGYREIRPGDKDESTFRMTHDETGQDFHFSMQAPSGRWMRAHVNRETGTISINGLLVQALPGALSFSYNGERVSVPVTETGAADVAPVQSLFASWRAAQNPADLEAFRARLEAGPSGGKRTMTLSCPWAVAGLTAATLAYGGVCSAGLILVCLGQFVTYMIVWRATADICGWCGFGVACGGGGW